MDKPKSRYQVIEKGGRLITLVDGEPVSGIATHAPHAQDTGPRTMTTAPAASRPAAPVADAAPPSRPSRPTPWTAPADAGQTPAPPSPQATSEPAEWIDRLGAFGLSIFSKGRSASGLRIIRRTIRHKPHQVELSPEEEREAIRRTGYWLLVLFAFVIALPAMLPVGFVPIFLLLKYGWQIIFHRIPPHRWIPL